MHYKYQRNQIFGKRLPVPKNIRNKIYNCTLSFTEFIEYDLEDKIPLSCLIEEDLLIVEKFGLERSRKLDWELINGHFYYYLDSIKSLVLQISPNEEDINACLWELLKDKIRPKDYSLPMKKKYSDRLFDLDQNNPDIVSIMTSFNNGDLSLEKIVSYWDLFKDKDLSYCLLHDINNEYKIDDSLLKSFMNQFGGLSRLILEEGNIYTLIHDFSSLEKEEDKKDYIKKFCDHILDRTHPKRGDYHIPLSLTNDEYKEIFQHTSMKEFLLRRNPYSKSAIERLILELESLPEDYIYQMPVPVSLLDNYDVLSFVSTFGLKNVVDFDLECGNFFTKDHCQMLLLMFDMYMHYAGNEHDPSKNIYTRNNYDENGNYVERIYTKDEFYEAMRRMIIYGPSDW